MRVGDDNGNEGYKLNESVVPYTKTRRDGLMVGWIRGERENENNNDRIKTGSS